MDAKNSHITDLDLRQTYWEGGTSSSYGSNNRAANSHASLCEIGNDGFIPVLALEQNTSLPISASRLFNGFFGGRDLWPESPPEIVQQIDRVNIHFISCLHCW
jgi:hypothetical protein